VVCAKYPVDTDPVDISYNIFPDARGDDSLIDYVDGRSGSDPNRADPYADSDDEHTRLRQSTRADALSANVYRYHYLTLPILSTNSLTGADQKAYTGAARDGCYSVNYNSDDKFSWKSTLFTRFPLFFRQTGAFNNVIRNTFSWTDILDSNWETGVVLFSGIASSASIQQETRSGVEFQAVPGSAFSSQQEETPAYDPTSQGLVKIVKLRMRSGYPASYNDWGKLWNVIKGIIPTALNFIPGVGPLLAGLAPAGMGLVEGMFGKKKGAKGPLPPGGTTMAAHLLQPQVYPSYR